MILSAIILLKRKEIYCEEKNIENKSTKEKEKKIVIKIKLEEIQELLPAELTEQNEIKSYILDILGKSAQKAAINSNCT